MLNIATVRCRLYKITVSVFLLALLASCGLGKVNEETFSLYIDNKNYQALVSTLQVYSSRNSYHVTLETLAANSSENTSRHIMLEGNGIRFLIQSALAEQCVEREGRRDVEYSQKVFDVNAFSTAYFKSNSNLSKQVNQLKDILTTSGFRIVSRSESCNLL